MSHDITEVLTAHIQRKRKELERLQQAAAAIPQVQHDLEALERTLAILRPNHLSEYPSQQPASRQTYDGPPEPYPQLVQAILRERGVPLTGDQIVEAANAQGKTVKRTSLMGGMYRCIKEGKLFKLIAPGTFGLLEWDAQPDEQEEAFSMPLGESDRTDVPLYETAPLGSPNGAV